MSEHANLDGHVAVSAHFRSAPATVGETTPPADNGEQP